MVTTCSRVGRSVGPDWFVLLVCMYRLQPLNNVTMLRPIIPGPGMLDGQAMMVEAILTFNLLFVALSVTNPRGKIAIMPSLPIAFCIGTGIMAAVS